MSSRLFTTDEVDSSTRLLLEQTTSTPRCRSGECVHNQVVSISLAVLYFNLHFRCLALMHQENDQSSVTAEADGLLLDFAFGVINNSTRADGPMWNCGYIKRGSQECDSVLGPVYSLKLPSFKVNFFHPPYVSCAHVPRWPFDRATETDLFQGCEICLTEWGLGSVKTKQSSWVGHCHILGFTSSCNHNSTSGLQPTWNY